MKIRLNPLTAWAVGTVAVAATLLLAAGTPQLAAAVLASFLFVVVPGYALASAAFPLTTSGFVERSLIALVLGFVAAIAGGLLLHVLGGIEARGWLAWWAGIVLVAGSYVAWRTRRNRDEVLDVVIAPPAWRMSRRQAAYLVLALVIAGTSVRVARTGLEAQSQSTFTQLWMLPNAEAGFIDVGIANEEDQPTVYRVEITMGDDVVAQFGGIALDAGARWSTTLPVPDGASTELEARLYRSTDNTAYRRVSYWPQG